MDFWLKTEILRKLSHEYSTDTPAIEEEMGIQTGLSSKDNIKEQMPNADRPKRKHNESNLEFGFTCTGKLEVPVAECILC
ncbi:hypothetical protein NPIL_101371 [Nephila pilipes]|uniref:Uncharacterized protein n=1 Tax=Nephila pilipes TaxID=299642 RepID=A0A8X6TKK3_NEPPI|nr:hypothetical protein NPIL_101371 [Nephila pilipes]